jgi:TonB family protein
MINAESPVAYPPALYAEGVEGSVILRLFVDESGEVAADSTQIAEGSGRVEFDSAAVRGVSAMRFAPARRDGTPVATVFLQPVHFRLPTEP